MFVLVLVPPKDVNQPFLHLDGTDVKCDLLLPRSTGRIQCVLQTDMLAGNIALDNAECNVNKIPVCCEERI